MQKSSLRLAGALFATVLVGSASALQPLGPEFQLNTMTTGPQFKPSVCRDASGKFVAVWGSFPDFGPCQQCATTSVATPFLPFTINGQRFDSVGEKVGTEFVVDSFEYDTSSYSNPVLPAIGCAADGSFVVTWSRLVTDTDFAQTSGICFDEEDSDVFMQRYNSDGQPAGILQVNSDSDYGLQISYRTAVGVQDDGDFVVTWSSFTENDGCFATTVGLDPGDDGDDAGIFAKRFDSAGFAQGTEFQVNTYTTDGQYYPAVSSSDDGFTVAWTSYGSDGDRFGVGARRFDSSGAPLGTEFQVNTHTTGDQGYFGDGVSVSRGDQGDFVVVWKSAEPCCFATTSANASPTGRRARGSRRGGTAPAALNGPPPEPSTGVRGRLYDSSGAPVGDEFEVSDSQHYYYFDAPMVAIGSSEFLVVWDQPSDDPFATTSAPPAFHGDVLGRRFARVDASPIDSAFVIPEVTDYLQFQPDVASNGSDDFVIVWGSGYYLLGPLNATGAVTSGTDPRDPDGVFGVIGIASTTATATVTSTATATATATDTPTPTASSTATATSTPFLPVGVVCVDDSQCTSSFCRDGVCCETACDGATEVCNLPDQLGTCVEVAAPAPAVSPRGMLVAIALLAMVAFVGLLRLRRT